MKNAVKFKNAVSYRIALKVNKIFMRLNGDTYPICPRCSSTLEREYMSYCNCCGQRLGWSDFDNAKVISALDGRRCEA